MSDLENSYAHLTNTSINKNSASYSTVKEGIKGGCKWSLHQFMREYPDHALGSPLLWQRIKAIISLTMLSIAAQVPPPSPSLLTSHPHSSHLTLTPHISLLTPHPHRGPHPHPHSSHITLTVALTLTLTLTPTPTSHLSPSP